MAQLTKTDVGKYLLKIQLNFDNAYRFQSDYERGLLLESWMDILQNYSKEICDIAVNNVLAQAKFAPRIGDIVEEIKILQSTDSKSDEELWAELMSIKYEVFNESLYLKYPQQFDEAYNRITTIYNKLSPDLRLFLVNASSLIDFANITNEDLPYERTLFYKRMPILRKHSKDKIAAQNFLQLTEQKVKQLKSNKKF